MQPIFAKEQPISFYLFTLFAIFYNSKDRNYTNGTSETTYWENLFLRLQASTDVWVVRRVEELCHRR